MSLLKYAQYAIRDNSINSYLGAQMRFKFLLMASILVVTACKQERKYEAAGDALERYVLCVDLHASKFVDEYKISFPPALDLALDVCEDENKIFVNSLVSETESKLGRKLANNELSELFAKSRNDTKNDFLRAYLKRSTNAK